MQSNIHTRTQAPAVGMGLGRPLTHALGPSAAASSGAGTVRQPAGTWWAAS